MKLTEMLYPKQEFRNRVKKAFLKLQQDLIDANADDVDVDIKDDPMYGFRLKVSVKDQHKSSGVTAVVLRFEQKDLRGRTHVNAMLDGKELYYRDDHYNDLDGWDAEPQLELLAKEVTKVVMRRASPQVDKWSRQGSLNALETKYKSRWKKATKLDGRYGVTISALKSSKKLDIYVAKTSDHPYEGQGGFLIPSLQQPFVPTRDALHAYINQWVKDNP